MQKITPHLWYDKEAFEAASLYVSLFDDARIIRRTVLPDTPSGDAEVVSFELAGQRLDAISAGPYFKFTPALSFTVLCESDEEMDRLWDGLIEGGQEMMPLQAYPFSERYGWLTDRYGLNWQLMKATRAVEQKINVNFLFSSESNGRALEAAEYYTKLFPNSQVYYTNPYGEGEAQVPAAKHNFVGFVLDGQSFSAMDNGYDADYTFTEAFSLMVRCKDQEELDHYWTALSAVPAAEQCGWCKDSFGVSWQIVPEELDTLMSTGSAAQQQQVNEALLKMKKLDIQALKDAWNS